MKLIFQKDSFNGSHYLIISIFLNDFLNNKMGFIAYFLSLYYKRIKMTLKLKWI
jgi:hypothetical protein